MENDTQLMKGIFEGCILALLLREPAHGYRVVERMRALGFSDVAETTVYPILTRLEKKGKLTHSRQPSPYGPPRKVYALAPAGAAALMSFSKNWENVSLIVGEALKEVQDAKDKQ